MKLTFSKKDMEETEKVLLVNHLPKVNPEPHSPRYTYPNKFMPSLHPPELISRLSKEGPDFILTRNLTQSVIKRNELMFH